MSLFFFFTDTATTEIYTLSLHDALPICGGGYFSQNDLRVHFGIGLAQKVDPLEIRRSEEHTSELLSRRDLVCRLLLEKKKNKYITHYKSLMKISQFLPICIFYEISALVF